MNKRDFAAAAATLLIFLPSCFTSRPEPKVELQEISPAEEGAVQKTAEDFAGGFIKSLETGDYSHWQKFIPKKNASNLDQKKFDKMRDELTAMFGKFVKASYLGKVVTGKLNNYLWVLTFEKVKDGTAETFEIVYFVRVHSEKGKAPTVNKFGVKIF